MAELTRDEIVGRAYEIAAQHGLQASGVEEVEREHGRWKVELRLAGGGKAKVRIDGRSGAELRFKAEGHHRRHGEDDDEDD